MAPVATTFFFYFLSGLAILSGVLVITRKNPVHSALALILTLLSVAGLYLMLYAPFVAGVQIILYVGGIMVLFLFVIMLVNIERSEREKQLSRLRTGMPKNFWEMGAVSLSRLMIPVPSRQRRSDCWITTPNDMRCESVPTFIPATRHGKRRHKPT